MAYMRGTTRLAEGRHEEARAELERAEAAARRLEKPDPDLVRSAAADLGNVALEEEDWHAAEAHFRRALVALPDDAPSARRQARSRAVCGHEAPTGQAAGGATHCALRLEGMLGPVCRLDSTLRRTSS